MDSTIIAAIITATPSFINIFKDIVRTSNQSQSEDINFDNLRSEVIQNIEILENAKTDAEADNANLKNILKQAISSISIAELSSKNYSRLLEEYKSQVKDFGNNKYGFENAFNRAKVNLNTTKRSFLEDSYWINSNNKPLDKISTLIEKFEILKFYLEKV